jgi:hypothetical protein
VTSPQDRHTAQASEASGKVDARPADETPAPEAGDTTAASPAHAAAGPTSTAGDPAAPSARSAAALPAAVTPALSPTWKALILASLALSTTALVWLATHHLSGAQSDSGAGTNSTSLSGRSALAASAAGQTLAQSDASTDEETTSDPSGELQGEPTGPPPAPPAPSDLRRSPVFTLGQAVLMFMPQQKERRLPWDHLAQDQDRPAVLWLDDPTAQGTSVFDENPRIRTMRRGVMRIWVDGKPVTRLGTRLQELWWGVQMESIDDARWGVEVVRFWPGYPTPGSCWGWPYQGCHFNPMASLQSAGIKVTLLCRSIEEVPWSTAYLLKYPGRADTILIERFEGGSSGGSTVLALDLSLRGKVPSICTE